MIFFFFFLKLSVEEEKQHLSPDSLLDLTFLFGFFRHAYVHFGVTWPPSNMSTEHESVHQDKLAVLTKYHTEQLRTAVCVCWAFLFLLDVVC